MYQGVDLSGLTNIQSSAMTWDTIKRMRDTTRMKIVLKGILAGEDAELAAKPASTRSSFPTTARAARTRPFDHRRAAGNPRGRQRPHAGLVDSGFRRGTDIVKMSVPRRKPELTRIGMRPRTASTISGSASMVERPNPRCARHGSRR